MRPRHALVLFALLPSRASADTLYGTRGEVREKAHEAQLVLDRGHATMVVRRTFANLGPKHDQAELHIYDLPDGAVATGLATMGTVAGKPVWYVAELLEAELAAKKYRELTGIGGYYPKDPALLSWRSQSELALQVFPIDPNGQKTIEYTVELPSEYVDGKWHVQLPAMSTADLAATVTVKAASAKDALAIDGVVVTAGSTKRMLGTTAFDLVPNDPPKLGGRYASVSFAKERTLVHASFEAAPRLSEAPKGAYVVIAVDGSKSMDDGRRAAARSAIEKYLAFIPDAKVQIVAFDRFVRPLTDGFVDRKSALAKLSITPRNGSAIDLALEDAAKRIVNAPAGAPRRVLVLSDMLTRSAVDPAKLASFAATHAIVHVASISEGNDRLGRDDVSPWAALPRSTGGLFWYASANAKASRVFEEWARPLRIDRLVVKGLDDDQFLPATTLREGEGWSELQVSKTAAASIEIRGELWSTPLSTTIASSAAEERRWSALVFGTQVMHELKESEMMTLAKKGGAVSPVTSYLAVEPGVRPSTAGLDESEGIGLGGIGTFGHGSGSGHLAHLTMAKPDPRLPFLRARVTEAVAACGGEGRKARVLFETTKGEIVAADTSILDAAKLAPAAAKDEALRRCIEEKMWVIDLPAFFTQPFAKLDVTI